MKRIVALVMFTQLLTGIACAGVITITTDAHVRGGINANSNYGTNEFLWVRDTAGANDQLKIYMEVDAGSILVGGEKFSGVSVNLKSALTDTPATTLSLYGIVNNGDSWTETGVTWNNAPQNNTASGTALLGGAQLLATLDIPASTFIAGNIYSFSDTRIAEYLNWTTGVIADPYGNGASADTKATFVVVSSAAGVLKRFSSSESTQFGSPAPYIEYSTVVPEPATVSLFVISAFTLLVMRKAVVR
jgi:hypothetical protein